MFQKNVVEKIKTHFVFNKFSLRKSLPFFEIRWKNIVEPGRPHMTIWHMSIAYWIPKATNTHSECVILVAFPLQLWFHARNLTCYVTRTLPVISSSYINYRSLAGIWPPSTSPLLLDKPQRKISLFCIMFYTEFMWALFVSNTPSPFLRLICLNGILPIYTIS